ncbi:hypothetical protein [Variovorax paradoxus]|uniref:LamG domain-containing protein n=1 Tax=Variovorax paradoxus TaxID=34073 RepID=A0A0H2LWX3_VARPD|nr:hypothetical protein [Variovorax paradoxus]KLN54743.1 hypothetical protein VPARA_40470 [Variovorax paradoxus]
MANYVFPVADLRISIPGAPIIAAEPVFPFTQVPEVGALGDWILGPDASSLAAFGGDATLTPQAATHVWSPNFVRLKTAGEALVSSIHEAADMTFYFGFRYRVGHGKNSLVVANITPSLSVGGGFAVNNGTDGSLRLATYGPTTNTVNMSPDGGAPPGLVNNDWAIGVVSLSASAVRRKITGSAAAEAALTNPRVLQTQPIAIGNAYFNGNAGYFPIDLDVATFGVIPGYMSLAEIEELYQRLDRRLEARGL